MLYYLCTEVTLKRKSVKSVKDAGGEMLQWLFSLMRSDSAPLHNRITHYILLYQRIAQDNHETDTILRRGDVLETTDERKT